MLLKYLGAYAAALVVLVAIDLVWLGAVAKPLYQQGIGHLMAAEFRMGAAVLFYAIYIMGLMLFAVTPLAGDGGSGTWGRTLLLGALFGFFAYATYDFTNLATLRGWPVGLSVIDMAWGAFVSAVASAAGKAAFDRL